MGLKRGGCPPFLFVYIKILGIIGIWTSIYIHTQIGRMVGARWWSMP